MCSSKKYLYIYAEKNEKLFGNVLGRNVENTPDYPEISIVNKINNKAFQINVPNKSEM